MGSSAAFQWPRLGVGVGLRKDHQNDILAGGTALDWLEIITENYLDTQGLPRRVLLKLRQDYSIISHSVSLSIASTDSLDFEYLRRLKDFFRDLEPAAVSDHLCWTGVDHQNLHQLLPLPRTEEVVNHVAARIATVQEFLGRRMLFENISTYLDFSTSEFPEWEFLAAIAEKADCGLLLDVTNLYLNAHNHGFSTEEYLRGLPKERVGQYHLSGHVDHGAYLFDSHSRPVAPPVWDLYRRSLETFGPVSTLIEWDAELPAFTVLESDVIRAKDIQKEVRNTREGRSASNAAFTQALND